MDKSVAAGKRVVVPCMTRAQAARVAAKYTSRGLNVGLYTSATSPEVMQEHMRDVHGHWSKLDMLVYSPAITGIVHPFSRPLMTVSYWFRGLLAPCPCHVCLLQLESRLS